MKECLKACAKALCDMLICLHMLAAPHPGCSRCSQSWPQSSHKASLRRAPNPDAIKLWHHFVVHSQMEEEVVHLTKESLRLSFTSYH